MKVLVIGGGGREHAIVKALCEDKNTGTVYLLPGRPSVKEAKPVPSDLLKDSSLLLSFIKEKQIELVIVGPEKPLVEGLADDLRKYNVCVFGPSKEASQLEGSKIFAKEFMRSYHIPTAPYGVVSSVAEALKMSEQFPPPYVLKADGLAGGKGVFVCETLNSLKEKAVLLFEKQIFGTAGKKALLEQFQKGEEMSVFLLINGRDYELLPFARDYKRIYEGQRGPNTGGMGAVAPVKVSEETLSLIKRVVVTPTMKGLKDRGYSYRGVLYIGLMLHNTDVKVLEYNIRFGDPEVQVLLPLLEGSWLEVFYKTAKGEDFSLKWKSNTVYSLVVLSARGYPQSPVTGDPIEGSLFHKTAHSDFIHAGISQNEKGQWVTAGGRVLNAIAEGRNLKEARERVYQQIERMSWQGMHFRKDIGLDLLK